MNLFAHHPFVMNRFLPSPGRRILAAVASIVLLSSCGGGTPPPAASKPPATKAALTVNAVALEDQPWGQAIPATGSIAAWQESAVGSEIGGLRLKEVAAQVGDVVKKGHVMATLHDETVLADLAQAKAGLREAEAAFAEAKANGDRARKFEGTGAISQQQGVQYLTAEQTAKARIDVARARVETEELRLRQTRVVAPDDGIVSARVATLGTVVQPGQELFRLILKGRLEWRAEVSAADLSKVRSGAPASLTLPSGATAKGRVRVVAPSIDPQTRNGIVYVDLSGGSEARAGMFARGELQLGQSPAAGPARVATLPQSAVLLRDGFAWVFRIGPDRKVAQVKVATGRRAGDRIEIVSGLVAGDRVVGSGVGFLADGDVVDVVDGVEKTQGAGAAAAARPAAQTASGAVKP
jgi:RND family efflux transporter MFP subunit